MDSVQPADKYITVNGLKLHYLDWGSDGEKKQDMLLLHGLGGHGHFWDFFSRSLKDNYRILALDQRGHGDSDWSTTGYATEQYVSDLAGLAEQLGLDKFVLVGLSLGGRNAMAYASSYPHKLDRLVLVDIGPVTDPRGSARVAAGQQTAPETFDSEEELLEHGLKAFPRFSREMAWHRMQYATRKRDDGRFEWRYDRLGLMKQRQHGQTVDLWEPIKRISCPTLLVRGADSDVLASDVAQRMVETIPNCAFTEVDSGHSVPGDNPAAFEKAVRDFLKV